MLDTTKEMEVKRQEIGECELTADIVLGLMQDPTRYSNHGLTVLETSGPVKLGKGMPWVIISRTAFCPSGGVVKDTDIQVLIDDGRAKIVPTDHLGWERLELVEDE